MSSYDPFSGNKMGQGMPELLTRDDFITMLQYIEVPEQRAAEAAKHHWNNLCKPIGSLGTLEVLHQRLAAISENPDPDITPRAVFVFAADNGIVDEGVTQCGQEVTAQVLRNIAAGKASINILAKQNNATVIPVNLAVRDLSDEEGIIHVVVKEGGSNNFAKEAAMSEEEMMLAIQIGYEMANGAIDQGYKLLIAGEMGIGNTSTSTAVLSVLEDCKVESICGRGAGLSDQGFLRKQEVLHAALKKYDLSADDPLTVLRTVGGFDLAAMVGFYAAAALRRVPIVLDGFITLVAARILYQLEKNISHYLIAVQYPAEPGCEFALKTLGLDTFIDLGLRHGEGTAAVMALPILDSAVLLYRQSETFAEGGVEAYEIFD